MNPGTQKHLATQAPAVVHWLLVPKSGFAQVASHSPIPQVLYRSFEPAQVSEICELINYMLKLKLLIAG